MRKSIRILIVLALTGASATLPADTVEAAGFAKVGTFVGTWESLARDARSEALGGADMAVASGPLATLTNAAPVRESNRVEAGFNWFEYHSGSDIQTAGCSLQAGRWRFGVIGARWKLDPMVVRTAYNPEGTGETFEMKQDYVLLSTAFDLGRLPAPQPVGIDWTIGFGMRHHRNEYIDYNELSEDDVERNKYDAWDSDLGLTGRWSTDLTDGYAAITGSFLLRNPFEESIDIEDREADLPRYRNLGLAAEVGKDVFGTGRNDLRLTVMIASRKNLYWDGDGFFGESRIGLEITLLDLASLRLGTDEARTYAADGSWGLGLELPARFGGPFIARYSYTNLDGDEDLLDLERDQHTVTAGVRF